MAKLEFRTLLFSVWHETDYSKKFEMKLTAVKPRRFYEVRDSRGSLMGEGYTAKEALASLAEHLNVRKDEICKSRMVVQCRKDAELVYEIHDEGEGCHIFDPHGAPVGNKTFRNYAEARTYCKELLR